MSSLSPEAYAVIEGRHSDPFRYLGPHVEGDVPLVRIFLPDAEGVAIVDEQGHLCRQSCCRWSTSRAFAVHRLCEVCCYYKELRTHRSLNNDAPIYRAIQHVGCIVFAPVLGGLHHHYCRI